MNSSDLNAASLSPLEAARALAPQIRACAEEIESTRELPRALFEAIADAGMFHLAVPRDIGGAELDLPTFVQVIEEIAKADASTAWAINQGGTFATRSAFMVPEVARAIWIDTPRSVVSNTPGPTAKAVAVPGGYRVTGRQPFSTGIRHASWVAAHAQIFENGELRRIDGQPEARYLLMPKAEAIVHDTWNTRGMRGTGTHTFEVNDVFVPEARTVFPKGGKQISGGVRYKIPFTLMFASGDGMAALGVARSCLTAFYELAGAKTPRYVKGLMREQPITQFTAGQAEGALRSGRALLMEAVNNLWHELSATGEISLERRVELRLAGTHAIHLAKSVVDSIYQVCGATAIFEGNPIQRHFQDIHVITQHVQGRLSHYELVGQHWLGLKIEEARL